MSSNRLLTCVLVLTIILFAGSVRAAGADASSLEPADSLSPADWAAIRANLPGDSDTAPPPRPEAYSGQIELTASDGQAGDCFGTSAVVFGDIAVVGAYLADIGANADQGAVYIYYRNQGDIDNWGQVAKITASDGGADDQFGESLSLYGDTLAVGSGCRGSVHLYSRNQGGADQWGETKIITSGYWQFGDSLDLWGDTLVVGNQGETEAGNNIQGAAHVYSRNQGGADNWGEVAELTASDGEAYDRFGICVSILCDTIAVGAFRVGDDVGAAYLYERNHGGANNWGEVAMLTASDGEAGDKFGHRLSLGEGMLAVAAEWKDIGANADQGAIYLFERNQGGADAWGETHILTAPDGGLSDILGRPLCLSGDTLSVNADGNSSSYLFSLNEGGAGQWGLTQVENIPQSGPLSLCLQGDTLLVGDGDADVGIQAYQGKAYIYTSGDGWKERKKQNDPYGAADDYYGASVEIDGEFAIVGAYGDNIGGLNYQGSASILHRNEGGGDQWSSVALLTASDGAADDNFGYSVALSGDTAVVGARFANDGQAYLFQRNNGGADNWGEVAIISGSGNTTDCEFGWACAIHGDTVLVGAPQTYVGGIIDRGAAYIFARNEGGADNWGEVAMITSADGSVEDFFGNSVALFGDLAVVAAPNDSHSGLSGAGSVYLFSRNQGGADNWGQVAKLTASDAEDEAFLGFSVDIWGDTVLAGAYRADSELGAAYIFERNQGCADCWGEVRKISASDGQAGDYFGNSVNLWADTALVGADRWSSEQGSAYLFQRNEGGADNWGEVDQLLASIGEMGDYFGCAVSVNDDIAIVGSYNDDIGPDANQGSVYFFYNHFPTSSDDVYSVNAGDTLNESAPGVLANDGDQNGDAFTAVKDSDPSSGTLDFYADGSFDYTPSGCPSQDSFTYHTTDTMEDSPIATVTIDMIPAADLILTKTDASDPACVGVPFDYGITVFNNGPCEATAVTLSDTLPTGFGSISAVPSQGSCGVNGQLVTCDLGTVAASAGATVTITSTPSSAGSVDNTASVAATEDDPYASNNSDTESTQVLSGPPAAPSAPSVTDNDPCAQDGVSVTWTGVSGADGYDLQVDGLTIVSDVMSPHTYDPGDTDPHDYQVRAWNGCGSSGWSSATQGTDAHASDPGAPAIVVITDDDACGTGVTITFTPGSGATSHDLWVDGAEAATGISSPCGYDPGIPGFNGYVIRANNALCHTDSPVSSFEDADNSPMPSIMGDMGNLCPDETVSLATETGMSNYQWYLDGSPISGATSDNYTATQSGEYTVSYTEGSGCSGTSAMHWVDIFSCGGSGIYPAPDGSGGTTPLTGLWMGADMIHVEWDATTCPAMDYNIIYGSLDNVFSYTLIGGECNLGALGSYDWMAPTGTDLYFLVVGTDGTGIESSWGTDSLGAERNGTNHSGTCMAWDKDTTETCP